MGLDNMPYTYPCKAQGTAVLEPRKNNDGEDIIDPDTGEVWVAISCEKTQACGGCPYKNAYDKSGLEGGRVYGIFGTDCWYRGKYGNALLSMAGYDTDESNFYGDNEDGTYKSPESCLDLADLIGSIIDEDTDKNGNLMHEGENIAPDLRYAEWYLRWAAETCGGLAAWY